MNQSTILVPHSQWGCEDLQQLGLYACVMCTWDQDLVPASFLVKTEPGLAVPEWQQVRPNQSWPPSWCPSFTSTINLMSFLPQSVAAGRVAVCSTHYPMLRSFRLFLCLSVGGCSLSSTWWDILLQRANIQFFVPDGSYAPGFDLLGLKATSLLVYNILISENCSLKWST